MLEIVAGFSRVAEAHLAALPGFTQCPQAHFAHNAFPGNILPFIEGIELRSQRQVQKAIAVSVHAIT